MIAVLSFYGRSDRGVRWKRGLPICTAVPDRHGGLSVRIILVGKLKAFGHDARLIPANYVRPYSKGQKSDFRDAEAIATCGAIWS
jgi:transposase